MASQGYSSDFVGPIMPASSGSSFMGPPAPSFSYAPPQTFYTPTMQNFAATSASYSPPPRITFQAPPSVSFPSIFTQDGARKDWSAEVLMPSYSSIKPLVTPPKVFEPSTILSDVMQQQVRQATSKVSNEVISGINSRVSADATVLDFLKPIIGSPVAPSSGAYALRPVDIIEGNYKDRATFLENLERANEYRMSILAPTLSAEASPINESVAVRPGKEPRTYAFESIKMGDPVTVYDSPEGSYTLKDKAVTAPVSLGPQIQLREDLQKSTTSFDGFLPGAPLPSPEHMGSEVIRHELSHYLWGSDLDMRTTLFGLRDSNKESLYLNDFVNASAKTYPEYSFTEYGPPVDAIQREYLKQSGGTRRIENAQQYEAFMQQYEGLTPEQINALPAPMEFRRALMYRVINPSPARIDRGYMHLLPGSMGRTQSRPNFVPATA
jgi:hypothetical protein